MSGKVIMPGMIHPHDSDGLDVSNENLPVTPFLDVYDAIDPSRQSFENLLRNGVTSVHEMMANDTVIGGVSRVLRPIGMTIEEMTVAPDFAIKISITPKRGYDRMRQMATLRETFRELDDYLERLAETAYEGHLEENDETLTVGPAEARERGVEFVQDDDYDDQHRNLVRLREGTLDAWIFCGAATDVKPALDLAEAQGFLEHTILVLDGNAHLAIDEIAASGRPVVLPADLVYRDRDPVTGEMEETFLPSVFHEAGVMFALQPNPSGSMAEQYLTYQAAMCVRHGIPRDEALQSITSTTAAMLGLGDHLGTIEAGKAANLAVLSGDPLDFNSWVDLVFIDGVQVYDRAEDPRLERILNLEEEADRSREADNGAADEGAADDAADTTAEGGEADGDGAAEAGDGEGDG